MSNSKQSKNLKQKQPQAEAQSKWEKVMKFFRHSCHQDPAKSFFVGKYQMPFCSRCLGVYIGMIIGIIISSLFFGHITLPMSMVFIIIMGIDWIAQNKLNLYNSNISRLISGVSFGCGSIMFFCSFIMLFL